MNDLLTYLAAMLILVILMVGWALVQGLWRKTFREHISDTDVLAERRNCGNCGCTTICENKNLKKSNG